MVMNRKSYVYFLLDPRDGTVFYVGVSSNPARRLDQHMAPSGSASFRRCDEILDAGLWPTFVLVAECADRIDALWIEREMIYAYPGLVNSKHTGAMLSLKQYPPDQPRLLGDVKVFSGPDFPPTAVSPGMAEMLNGEAELPW